MSCTNVVYGTCTSDWLGEKPDMSLGDTCLLCCCFECERCDVLMDLGDENCVADVPDRSWGGWWACCDSCLKDTDVLYDEEQEVERRA